MEQVQLIANRAKELLQAVKQLTKLIKYYEL